MKPSEKAKSNRIRLINHVADHLAGFRDYIVRFAHPAGVSSATGSFRGSVSESYRAEIILFENRPITSGLDHINENG
jgi:hypothetical protein